MSITQPDDRVTSYNPVVATTTFAADFPVFDNDDIAVFVDGVERDDFSVSATYVQGISNDARAVFSPGITGQVLVVGARDPKRTNRFLNGGPISIPNLNLAFDTLQGEMQESHRDLDRSLKAEFGQTGAVLESGIPDNSSLMKVGDKIKAGPDVVQLANQAVADATTISLDAASRSENARDVAVGAAGDTVAQGFVPIYDSRDTASAYNLSAFAKVTINRWSASSKIASADYRKVDFAPAHNMKFQDIAGNWFELSEEYPAPEMAGAFGDGVTDDTPAFVSLQNAFRAVFGAPGATYVLGDFNPVTNAHVDLTGCFVKRKSGSKHAIILSSYHSTVIGPDINGGNDWQSTAITANAALGSTSLVVASAASLRVGMLVVHASDWRSGVEPNEITGIVGNTITLRHVLRGNVASGARLLADFAMVKMSGSGADTCSFRDAWLRRSLFGLQKGENGVSGDEQFRYG